MKINKINIEKFKCIDELEVNFEEGINLIYGPNGSGKTSIAESFSFLIFLLNKRNMLGSITNNPYLNLYDEYSSKNFDDEPINIKLDCIINNHKVIYEVQLGKDDIVDKETMICYYSSRPTIIFDRSGKHHADLKSIFNNYDYITELKDETIISILKYNFAKHEYSTLNPSQKLIVDFASGIDYSSTGKGGSEKRISLNKSIVPIITIDQEVDKELLVKFEDFLCQIDKSIIGVSYRPSRNGGIYKELYFEKRHKVKNGLISYSRESTGTKNYVDIFNFFNHLQDSSVIIFDEIDNALHEALVNKLMYSIDYKAKSNMSQVILTTHNIGLMDNKRLKDANKILIDINYFDGSRKITKFTQSENKYAQGKKYLAGEKTYILDDGIIL